MAEIPSDDTLKPDVASKPQDTIYTLNKPIKEGSVAEQLISGLKQDFLPHIRKEYPKIGVDPVYKQGNLVAIDFSTQIDSHLHDQITNAIEAFLFIIKRQSSTSPKKKGMKSPTSFTDLLGTFRVKLAKFFIPIIICIASATFLSWLAYYQGGIQDINVAPYPDESSVWEVIANGIIPVLISAVFVTILWILIKLFGMIVFKIIMGLLVLFYTWYGFNFFLTVPFMVFLGDNSALWPSSWILVNNIIFFGSGVFFLIVGIQFFRDKLTITQRNLLVLSYGIFMGAIFGISLPTWTTISFAIFLSIWDIITVFYGPLGKIANKIKENQIQVKDLLDAKVKSGELSEEQAHRISEFVSLQEYDPETEKWTELAKKVEIEIGSGDLILYSALIANVFINTQNWLITGFVIAGVLAGAGLTMYILIKKQKMLPALPLAMALGIVMYFLGIGLDFLFTL